MRRSKWSLRRAPFIGLLVFSLAIILRVGEPGVAQEPERTPDPEPPKIAASSDEGRLAMQGFRYPANWSVDLFAAEPAVANPVALYVDHQGRVFVCESYRQEQGIEDNRSHPEWLREDLAARTVQDRIDYIRRHIPDADQRYTRRDDRIRLLVDSDGDGRADRSTVFADHFNQLEAGTGAGVLAWKGDVFYTCIPHLWRLRDTDGDGRADERTALHSGFGVRFAFRGHDLHGLTIGPAGRLYFSVGDRGYNVNERVVDPTSGAVFRCELDGQNLEVVATGLRNPQELAFDNYGNLFTGDNNSDSGDRARWVYVVPGGDSGWRMYYQYLPDRGPFNREKIWHPFHEATPAYIIPPVANIADGPSGLTFYPGTGLSEKYRDRFFLCDFRGTPGVSGVRTFRVKPRGAFWEVVDMDQTIWGTLATDVDFGPDGKIYVSDWVMGWVGENKGRVYTWTDKEAADSPLVSEVAGLLRGELAEQSVDELVALLGHADRRVRQLAQFELVEKDQWRQLLEVASGSDTQLARIHGIWGLAQWWRLRTPSADQKTDIVKAATKWLADQDPELRAQAAWFAGEVSAAELADLLAEKLADDSARVRYLGSMSLARLGELQHLPNLIRMLEQNADQDPVIRHAGIMALTGIVSRNGESHSSVQELFSHPSPSVRLAFCVALRRLGSPRIARFLSDVDPRIGLEAARAIHDLPLKEVLPELAKSLDRAVDDAWVRRAINANYRVGGAANARRLVRYAVDDSQPLDRRLDVIKLLGAWAHPDDLDWVLGDWRPIGARPAAPAREAFASAINDLLGDSRLVEQVVQTAEQLEVPLTTERLVQLAESSDAPAETRVAVLEYLRAKGDEEFVTLVSDLADSVDQIPDMLAAYLMRWADPDSAAERLAEFVLDPARSLDARRSALRHMAEMDSGKVGAMVGRFATQLENGDWPDELLLDLKVLSDKAGDASLVERIAKAAAAPEGTDPRLAEFWDARAGGDVDRGRQIFFGKTEVSCVRCHRVDGVGGEVGPELSGVGLKRGRDYLLQSIVDPNAQIAEGFNQTIVLTTDGATLVGLVKSQDDDELVLMDADGRLIRLDVDQIEDTRSGKSSMPDDLVQKLTREELRDLVEFLANCRSPMESLPAASPDDSETETGK